jgi:hypothetical protein
MNWLDKLSGELSGKRQRPDARPEQETLVPEVWTIGTTHSPQKRFSTLRSGHVTFRNVSQRPMLNH